MHPSVDPIEIARRLYLLDVTASPLPGEHDLNFRLETPDGERFVLKIARPGQCSAPLELQAAVLDHLAKANLTLQVPQWVQPVADAASPSAQTQHFGSTLREGQPCAVHLLTWVDGHTLRHLRHRSPALLEAWGACVGELSRALRHFEHPAAHRYLVWDQRHAGAARRHLDLIDQPALRLLAERHLDTFDAVFPQERQDLPWAVCYNDAHEDNLLVERGADYQPRLTGLIDVGDVVYTYAICELATACAYAAMDQPDPLAAILDVAKGYCTTRRALDKLDKLLPQECEVLFALIVGRLLTTVTQSALARQEQPDNAYRSVSEEQAWALLQRLDQICPRQLYYLLHANFSGQVLPERQRFDAWLSQQIAFHPIVHVDVHALVPLDLSVGSAELGHYSNYGALPTFERHMRRLLEDKNAAFGYGGYGEIRPLYTTDLFEIEGNAGPQWRTRHLGLDIWGAAGTKVMAPLAGIVHSFRQNDGPRDYGATIILQHDVLAANGLPFRFFTLYGHLTAASLQGLAPGRRIASGESFACFGESHENGGWPPHLHFQVILDLLDQSGDFPGVTFAADHGLPLSLCPDPAPLSGLFDPTGPQQQAPAHPDHDLLQTEANRILAGRKAHLGASLSTSYARPLHMVRGQGAFLLDSSGRRYLDTVNNVAHVGHEHPRVVEALVQQARLLNTNTRYLHAQLTDFAQALLATFPPSLAVVHFVNSGSEANELALRMARTYTGERDMIAVDVGYHGNTGAVVDVSSYKFQHQAGLPVPAETQIVSMPDTYRGRFRDPATAGLDYAHDVDAAIARIQAKSGGVAGFICESILSCGGQVVLPQGYLTAAFAKTRAAGGVCISDEVQTGLGRVGSHWWAFETQGVLPDIVTIGKPLGNGHPLAAVVCTRAIAEAFAKTGMEYFNTFGGNPVSAAVGLAVLRVIEEEGLRQNAVQTGNYLLKQLRQLEGVHPRIGNVRGLGLFSGIELVSDPFLRSPDAALARYVSECMRERGILTSTDGPDHNVLKFKPPMVFNQRHADRLIHEIDRALQDLH